MTTATRQKAYRHGLRQEWLAAWLLRFKGFSIVARRYRSTYGEIDLIARRGKLLVFVEIKARPSEAEALAAISPKQQQRVQNAAEHFLQGRGMKAKHDVVRFDAISCVRGKWPKHLPDAWRVE